MYDIFRNQNEMNDDNRKDNFINESADNYRDKNAKQKLD